MESFPSSRDKRRMNRNYPTYSNSGLKITLYFQQCNTRRPQWKRARDMACAVWAVSIFTGNIIPTTLLDTSAHVHFATPSTPLTSLRLVRFSHGTQTRNNGERERVHQSAAAHMGHFGSVGGVRHYGFSYLSRLIFMQKQKLQPQP